MGQDVRRRRNSIGVRAQGNYFLGGGVMLRDGAFTYNFFWMSQNVSRSRSLSIEPFSLIP